MNMDNDAGTWPDTMTRVTAHYHCVACDETWWDVELHYDSETGVWFAANDTAETCPACGREGERE